MDSFLAAANDLDRVLDEFEQNEESLEPADPRPNWKAIPCHLQGPGSHQFAMSSPDKPDFNVAHPPPHSNGLSLEDVQQGGLTNGSLDGDQRSQSDAASSSGSELLIDLSEADFAPSAKPSALLSALQESLASQKDQGPPHQNADVNSDLLNSVSMPYSDSNAQLDRQDLSTYMLSDSTRSMSVSDLHNIDSSEHLDQPSNPDGEETILTYVQGDQTEAVNNSQGHQPTAFLQPKIPNSGPHSTDQKYEPSTQADVSYVQNNHQQEKDVSSTSNMVNNSSMENSSRKRDTTGIDIIRNISESIATKGGMSGVQESSVESMKDTTLSQTTMSAAKEKGSPVSNSSSSSTPPVDQEIMQEYMRQGARPKLTGYKTPEQSPLKNTNETESTKEETSASVVNMSEKTPVIGFNSFTNVSVSQTDLDELDSMDAKPLAYDVSGGGDVSRAGPGPTFGPPNLGVTMPLVNGQPPYVYGSAEQEKGNPVSGSGTSSYAPSPGLTPFQDSQLHSPSLVPEVSNAPLSGTVGIPSGTHIASTQKGKTQQSSLLSIPNDQENDDRVSPLSKILEQQYKLEMHSPKTGDNELANMDPFYEGKQSLESSLEEEVLAVDVSTAAPQPRDSPSSQHLTHLSAPSDQEQSVPVLSTLGFGISEDADAQVEGSSHGNVGLQQGLTYNGGEGSQGGPEHSSGLHHQADPTVGLGVEGTNSLNPQQQINPSTALQALAPVQNFAVPAGAPPQLSPAQPVAPDLSPSPEVGVDASLEDPIAALPPDPPSYQQVEQATNAERHNNMTRQGLTLDFPAGEGDSLNGYPHGTGTVGHGGDAFNQNSMIVTPPNVSLDPNSARPLEQQHNGVMPLPGDQVPADFGQDDYQEGVDPMIAQNNALNAQHMLPAQPAGGAGGGGGSGGVAVPGDVAPIWIPDSDAPACMGCTLKFTFRKRRHHCRACGKVFCSKCCNVRVRLKYMDSKEARVCIACLNAILTAEALERVRRQGGNVSTDNSPAGSPAHQALAQPDDLHASAAESALQRSKSVLRRPISDGSRPRERRTVHFSDGTAPGMDSREDSGETDGISPPPPTERGSTSVVGVPGSPADQNLSGGHQNLPTSIRGIPELQGGNRRRLQRQGWHKSLIPEDETRLPPVILTTEVKGEFSVDDNPNMEKILADIKGENPVPAVFVLSKNLMVLVQIVDLNCCVNRTCWCFCTKGLASVGQDEVVIVLECLPEEKVIPRDVFCHFYSLYEDAKRGNTVGDMSHTIFAGGGFLGSRDHGGFLYVRPTFQCLQKLILPEAPYLFAVLLQKWETPWAKVFPLRLLLRLGAEFRYYPCPLMSVRFRKPVFGEIGHTIMNLLADFKNYQYKLPVIRGVVIHMEDKQTVIRFPRNRYDDLMKVLNNSNEHVMALAAVFSPDADSHLVCMQNEQGTYQTQAINIQNKPRKVTGASFVVFNGALKASCGLRAKSSIVEDGLMVQIRPETMTLLKDSMRQMQEMAIPCGSSETDTPEETVLVQWVEDDKNFNLGVASPIDGKSLAGVEGVRIHSGTECQGQNRAIRWTEVFFLQNGLGDLGGSTPPVGPPPSLPEPVDLSRLAESLAAAFCLALSGSLNELREAGLVKLGLRVTVDIERVGYEAGAKGHLLPPQYMNSLDNELIPVMHGAVSQHEGAPVVVELIFHIID